MKRETANERLKREFERWLYGGVMVAAAFHFALFRYFPELTAEDLSTTTTWTDFIPPPRIEIPPPPERIIRPQIPVVGSVRIDDSVTIAETTLEANPLPPPPPDDLRRGGVDEAFMVYTVAPRLKNRRQALRIVEQHYPTLLKEAGVTGEVRVKAFVDTAGRVQDVVIEASSGIPQLDEAALAAVRRFEFTPALNRDTRVSVWVQQLIIFEIR
jgi:protein TonB